MNVITSTSRCPQAMLNAVRTAKSFSEAFDISRSLSYHSDCHVTVARCKSSGQQVVVKTYMRHKLGTTPLLQVQTEVDVHSSLSHPHIVRMLLAFEDSRSMHVVIELADGGDLRKHMVGLTERRVRDFIALPLLQALAVLQHKGIVHRDLKPDNVLVHQNHVLLADFGLAMYVAPPTSNSAPGADDDADTEGAPAQSGRIAACVTLANNAGGTPLYTAPEVLLRMFRNQPMHDVVQHKNDIWALGVMVLEAATGHHPFSPENCSGYNGNVLYSIAHHKTVNLPNHLSPEMQDFLSQALQREAELRPTAEQLLRHPWVSSLCRTSCTLHRALSACAISADALEEDDGVEPGSPGSDSDASLRAPDAGSSSSSEDLVEVAEARKAELIHQRCAHAVHRQQHLLQQQHGMHRAYSAFEIDCWEH